MQNQTADVTWRAGNVPVSTRFDDPYFSLENGLAETRHVFLRANGLPERLCDGFSVAELGFGTGLNFLATLQMWEASRNAGRLRFTSFEAYPMSAADMGKALAGFERAGLRTRALVDAWRPGGGVIDFSPVVRLEVIVGDARQTVPQWSGRADAWYLDGFSPAKNPELWTHDLMTAVASHTAQGGTFATYTSAGFVRRSLAVAGFEVERVPGYGRKRHMSRGVLRA
ncbi:MAG: tRNA (5-methylaminomethyl-2-thiouridine)(34)-methyltransferase MnmD [Roseobacter sp.]